MVVTIDVRPLVEDPKVATDIVVDARGYIEEPTNDKTRGMFQMSKGTRKKAIRKLWQEEKLMTGNKTFAKCFSLPTLLGDPFTKCNWDDVTTCLHAASTEVTEMHTEIIEVGSKNLLNTSNKTGSFSAGLTYKNRNTVTKSCYNGKDIKMGLKMGYKVLLPVSANISFESSWGEDVQESEAVTVGSNSRVTVDLEPGEEVVANLRVTRYIIEVKVTYDVSLEGHVGCEFVDRFKWLRKRYHVNDLLEAANLSRTVQASEVFNICFCSNGQVVLSDG